MKFLTVSFALLVFSITYPEQLISQEESSQTFASYEEENLLETYDILHSPPVKGREIPLPFVDILRKSDTTTLSLKELRIMYKQLALTSQLINSFEHKDTHCLIQLESQWVDFRGQCQANFDKLKDLSPGKISSLKFLFYETLMGEFSPKAEVLIEAMWAEENEFLEKYMGESIDELNLLFVKAYGYLSYLEKTSILLVSKD
ncbi:MAG: hypothetical protein AAF696_05280 [Bacteroidota bacterium]